jgi:hypothetical protein
VSTVLKIDFSVICKTQKLLCTLHVCYDFSGRFEIVTAVLQKIQAFWEIVSRRFEGSWCLPVHSQAVRESITDPSKSREIFTSRHSATCRNPLTLRSDSSIIFVHTDNVTRTASVNSQQSPCCYSTEKYNKKGCDAWFQKPVKISNCHHIYFFYERTNLSLVVTLKAMLLLLTAYGDYEICFTQNKKLQH